MTSESDPRGEAIGLLYLAGFYKADPDVPQWWDKWTILGDRGRGYEALVSLRSRLQGLDREGSEWFARSSGTRPGVRAIRDENDLDVVRTLAEEQVDFVFEHSGRRLVEAYDRRWSRVRRRKELLDAFLRLYEEDGWMGAYVETRDAYPEPKCQVGEGVLVVRGLAPISLPATDWRCPSPFEGEIGELEVRIRTSDINASMVALGPLFAPPPSEEPEPPSPEWAALKLARAIQQDGAVGSVRSTWPEWCSGNADVFWEKAGAIVGPAAGREGTSRATATGILERVFVDGEPVYRPGQTGRRDVTVARTVGLLLRLAERYASKD